ncbi:cytochrome c oxidase subunit II [Sphingomonas oligophenolica]|uniref:Cytochrome c oxidase subunit 2 n=1 Tax=Sphingomonas oligophenolica TaxID=301154 RepID=A0A502CRG2_9SPHN|nr:cytochrome c oxidase subunit II [Sphingomonas oligophenolica]TPG15478.1 cytochrome c oxidase subunit II [Sphingomonas oligophenolica]
MRIGFKGSGLKGVVAAAALALTGFAPGVGAQAAQPAPQAAAAPADVSNLAPTSAAAPVTAAPASPELAMDGAPPMTVKPMVGQPTDGLYGLQPQVTKNGRRAHHFHDVILVPVIVAISLLVLFLLMWVVFRYREGSNPVPSKTSHNTTIEVLWTLIPVVILALIAIPSIGLLAAQYKPAPAGAITLKAIGNQWYWSYQYPDNGGFEITANMLKEKDQVSAGERYRTAADGPRLLAVDNRIVLPVGVPIRLITTSTDVIHSWAMPAFWIKLDAVPGRLNETSFTIEKPGLYFGQCSELCGARHGFMPIAVEAVPPAQFAAWVKAKGGTMPTPGQPSNKVIPQPGADLGDATSVTPPGIVPTSNGALENTTATPPEVTQGATATAPVGNVGR